MRRFLFVVIAVALLAGCAGEDEPEPAPERTSFSVYFLRDDKVAAARRTVLATDAVIRSALQELRNGPTADEELAGLYSSIRPQASVRLLRIQNGVAFVAAPDGGIDRRGAAQIVYTLTQFSSVKAVRLGCEAIDCAFMGPALRRASLEAQTPQIFVERPTVGERETSPIRIVGTANTFEANFHVHVLDAAGKRIFFTFVTATSGSGRRGTFDVELPVEADPGLITLLLFEPSAEDNSRLHKVRIPLRLAGSA